MPWKIKIQTILRTCHMLLGKSTFDSLHLFRSIKKKKIGPALLNLSPPIRKKNRIGS